MLYVDSFVVAAKRLRMATASPSPVTFKLSLKEPATMESQLVQSTTRFVDETTVQQSKVMSSKPSEDIKMQCLTYTTRYASGLLG